MSGLVGCHQKVSLNVQLSWEEWIIGVREIVLIATDMELDEMWVEFEIPVDGLEDVPTCSESLIWELRTTSGMSWLTVMTTDKLSHQMAVD
jgi:hypothetical protein